jgi:predicted nucleic-acid-binding protein
MSNFVCADTNIFIQCCLLESEDTLRILDDLLNLLNSDTIKLLLPEVIELEFYRVLETKTLAIKNQITGFITKIKNDELLRSKAKDAIAGKIQGYIDELDTNKIETLNRIKSIFDHKNTIRLPITPESLTQAYIYSLHKKKPYKDSNAKVVTSGNILPQKRDYSIQNDCIIVEILKAFIDKETSAYNFYFCTANTSDFSKYEQVEGGTKIHDNIKELFKHIELFTSLVELLTNKFSKTYPDELIRESKEPLVIIVESPLEDISTMDLVSPQIGTDINSPSPSPSPDSDASECKQ